ncbi:hypothetical protein H072_6707 [Dactylellina haptotyla CBS 200.50]|uniref:F-box domain-containing protein n=1 Tax=Dactylellina haptotyla (strain CBS 200.50) TaxID=1284197 RepID=S8BW42_DACHA|nr:hypothetical protein H072_6707 [Dactylellina haptotyla CBS 200.50]
MARYTMEPFVPKKAEKPSKLERLEEKATNAVRRIKRIRITNPPAKTTQEKTTRSTQFSVFTRERSLRYPMLRSPSIRSLVNRRSKSNSSGSSTANGSAARRVLFTPELLELILTYVPSLQVLTTIRQVHPFFKDLVLTSPELAWQTWTSKAMTPPRRSSREGSSNPTAGLYTINNSGRSTILQPSLKRNSLDSKNPVDLEVCEILLPILSKWWKTIARNTANYRFFQVDSCVYNRFFPPDLLKSINFTRPAIHVDDLILSFTSTYAFLSYECTHNITLEDRDQHNHDRNPDASNGEDDDDIPSCYRQNCPEELMMRQMDMSVTIEKLLRMMWIPLSETLRRSRDEKFLKWSGLKYTRTMTVTVRARDRVTGCERGLAELHLECMEPYDVNIVPLY